MKHHMSAYQEDVDALMARRETHRQGAMMPGSVGQGFAGPVSHVVEGVRNRVRGSTAYAKKSVARELPPNAV